MRNEDATAFWAREASIFERFCSALEAERCPRIEDFLADVAEPEYTLLLERLLTAELAYRGRRGEQPRAAEYQQRFPGRDSLLAAALQHAETVVGRPGSPPLPETAPDLLRSGHPGPAEPSGPLIRDHEILGVLGRGGMGVVYKARQVKLDRVVALKMIRAGDAADPEQLARFLREARAVALLHHPNIVQIYEIGEQDGQPFFVLEFVDGGSLDRVIDGKPQSPQDAARLLESLARAVQAAHQHGIVHRDLKPANILLQSDEGQEVRGEKDETAPLVPRPSPFTPRLSSHVPKIADFGLAKQIKEDAGQTRTGQVMGTPSYMAPEQAAGRLEQIGPASDVYALGAILYELLTGRPPFRGATLLDTLEHVRSREPMPPRSLQPRIPRDLETICLKCLAKEPHRRYSSALALAQDLERFGAGEAILASRESVFRKGWRKVRRNPVTAMLLLALTLAAAAAGYIYYEAGDSRRVTDLNSAIETELDTTDWSPARVGKIEQLAERLGELAPDQADQVRLRLQQRLIAFVNESLRRPTLLPDDVQRIEAMITVIGERSPEAVPELRRALDRRLRAWEVAFELNAPFADLAKLLDPARVTTDGRRVFARPVDAPQGQKPPDVKPTLTTLIKVPCQGNVQMEAEFDSSWSSAGEIGVLLNARLGHKETISALAFSPDGGTLASASGGWLQAGEVKIWDLAGRQEIASLRWGRGGLPAVQFTADGKHLILANNSEVSLLSSATAQVEEKLFTWSGASITCLALTGDRRLVAVGGQGWDAKTGGTVKLWDLTGRQELTTLTNLGKRVSVLAFSPDGTSLAIGGQDHPVLLWDLAAGKEVARFDVEKKGNVTGLTFAPDGRTLAATGSRLWMWDIASRQELSVFDLPSVKQYLTCVAYSADGRTLAVGSGLGLVHVWDVATRKRTVLQGPRAAVTCIALALDGTLASGSDTHDVRGWDLVTLQPRFQLKDQGYAFILRGPRVKDAKGLSRPAPLSAAGSRVKMQILRNGLRLQEQEVPVRPGPLHLLVRREGERLTFQVNQQAPLVSLDVFPLGGKDAGSFAVRWSADVRLSRLRGLRQALPATPSPLEKGDDWFEQGRYTEALAHYQQQALGGGQGENVREARYKEGLCLARLKRTDEAATLFERLAADSGERWPVLAACQLWLIRLEQNRMGDADAIFDSLAVRYRFEQLAASIPDEVRTRILLAYFEQSRNINLYKPDPQRVRNAERGMAVEDFLLGSRADGPTMIRQSLCRTYLAADLRDKALKLLGDALGELDPASTSHYAYADITNYCWLLRLAGQPRRALAEVERWLLERPGVYRKTFLILLLERARIHAALGNWPQADDDIDRLFRELSEDDMALYFTHACLLRGFLRERHGDTQGALAAWKEGAKARDAADPRFGFAFFNGLILASLADQFDEAAANKLSATLFSLFEKGDVGASAPLIRLIRIPPAVLREMWRSPRGRDHARRIAFATVSFAEYIHTGPKLLLAEMFHQGALPGKLSADQDGLIWDLIQKLYADFLEGKYNTTRIAALGLTWKGTTNFLGWGGVAPTLEPAVRGPLAYVFGQRYLRVLNRRADADTFLRTALADAGNDPRLRRLAQEALDQSKSK